MCFNLLNSKLSSNPFEFENFYADDKVRHFKNLQMLFTFTDRTFNPKTKQDKIDLKVSDFLGTLLTKETETKFIEHIKSEYKMEDTSKFENISGKAVSELCDLFDKTNAPHKKLGMPTLDKDFPKTINKF